MNCTFVILRFADKDIAMETLFGFHLVPISRTLDFG